MIFSMICNGICIVCALILVRFYSIRFGERKDKYDIILAILWGLSLLCNVISLILKLRGL